MQLQDMREYRSITFSEVELIRAIVERRYLQREALPAGTIRGASLQADADGKSLRAVFLRIEDDQGGVQEVTISPGEAAAALISHCLQRHIPMPRGAVKWVDVVDQEVALFMDMQPIDLSRSGQAVSA